MQRGSKCHSFTKFSLCYCVLAWLVMGTKGSQEEEPFREFVYQGKIRKNALPGDIVELDQPMYVRKRSGLAKGELCGYTVYKAEEDFPFRIGLLEPMTGSAYIYLASGSSIKNDVYNFEVAAHDCVDGFHSGRERVVISVIHPPVDVKLMWKERSYGADIFEGSIDRKIVRVSAHLWNGSHFVDADICNYAIVTPDVPFDIDDDGNLFNMQPLEYRVRNEYKFDLTAEDCNGVVSKKIQVTIRVKPVCFLSWKGIGRDIELDRGLIRPLFPRANMKLTGENCNPIKLSVAISLSNYDADQQCHLDPASISMHRKLCDVTSNYIELLSDTGDNRLLSSSSDDNGEVSLNGKTDVIVLPLSRLERSLGYRFVISTWLKHKQIETAKSIEQVLCLANDENSSTGCRLSISIQDKCYLVFSLRADSLGRESFTRLGKLGPTLWKWRVLQLCDPLWHHYVIVVKYPQVRMFVDGKEVLDNAEVIHEWPISSKANHRDSSLLIIGAEPQAGRHGMWNHLGGSLAGLTIWRNVTLNAAEIECISECREKLVFSAVEVMDDAMSVTVNSNQSEVLISGNKLESVVKLVKLVGYGNTRGLLATTTRNISIKTNLECRSGQRIISEPLDVKLTIKSPSDEISRDHLIAPAGDQNAVHVNKLHAKQAEKLFANKPANDDWKGIFAVACVGLLAVLVVIVIGINVAHWYCGNECPHLSSITSHDLELSQLNKHMTVIVNPFEEQDQSNLASAHPQAQLSC